MQTKQYEVITPPLSLQLPQSASEDQLARVVANWHRSINTTVTATVVGRNDEKSIESFVGNNNDDINSNKSAIDGQDVCRPPASHAINTSLHQLAVIKQFFKSGGHVSIFQSLSDPSSPPPSCRIILLDLQLIYNLKVFIGFIRFKDLTWDMKEGIPVALSRYSDYQIKDFSRKQLDDICWGIKDMVNAVIKDGTGYTHSVNLNIMESLEMMKMSMSYKLLSSSQLQKRYQGLSMVKDSVCGLFNKLIAFVEKRYFILGVKKNSVTGNQLSNLNSNSSNNNKVILSAAYIDRWLISNEIVELIFGESLHQDLAAKSDIVLSYMAHRNLLNEKHMDIIWTATKGAHEAVTRVIYLLILVVLPMLQYPLRLYLFNLISATPIKEYSEQYLNLVKSFTLQFLIANRQDPIKKAPAQSTTADKFKSGDSESNIRDGSSSVNRKGMVVNIAPRQWLGFGILWQFVQDIPKNLNNQQSLATNEIDRIDENLIDTAINLLVELLQEEFRDERDLVITRCLDNIQAGISVPVSLQILQKTLLLYPSHQKNWFSGISRPPPNKLFTVNSQIEKLVKNNLLLDILFNDLEKYHRSMQDTVKANNEVRGMFASKSNTDLTALNDRRFQTNSKKMKLRGITERLDFLKFLISMYNIKLEQSQANLLWDALGEGSDNIETLEKLFILLNIMVDRESKILLVLLRSLSQENNPSDPDRPSHLSLLFHYNSNDTLSGFSTTVEDFSIGNDASEPISTSAFEEGVVVNLYENRIVNWASQKDKIDILSNPEVAIVCFKLFLLLNITNKSLRVSEVDGSWSRTGRLAGVSVIWHIAINGCNDQVSKAAIALLIELHHRIPLKVKSLEVIKGNFLKQCFKLLYFSMQSLQSGDKSNETQTQFPKNSNNSESVDDVQFFDWITDDSAIHHTNIVSRRISRLILTLRLFIQRFYRCPTQLISVSVLAGRNDSPVVSMTMKATDTIGKLRLKLAKHFKESSDSVLISKIIGSMAKGQNFQNIAQERLDRDAISLQSAKFQPHQLVIVKKKDAPQSVPNKNEKIKSISVDLFKSEDILEDFINNINPIDWLSSDSIQYDLFHIPSHPWKSHIDFGFNLNINTEQNVDKDITFSIHSVHEYLYPHIRNSPFYIDQLLEMLDGYLSTNSNELSTDNGDLSVAVWDILQSLPTHSVLLKQIEDLVIEENLSTLSHLLDPMSPYRLLYSLQIIESFVKLDDINKVEPNRNTNNFDWAVKLFHIGGAEFLVQLLQSMSKKLFNLNNNNDNKRKDVEQYEAMSRDDVVVMIIGILHRIIHQLLLLDPSYSKWIIQLQNGKRPLLLSTPTLDKSNPDRIPSGVLVSMIDLKSFIPLMIDTLFGGFCLHNSNQISGLALLSLSDNILLLLLGLVAANDDGISILESSSRFTDIVKLLCVNCEFRLVREGTCRRLFDTLASLFYKIGDNRLSQDEKQIRLDIFNYFFYCVVKAIDDNPLSLDHYHDFPYSFISYEQCFNLIAIIESLRSAPHIIFPELKNIKYNFGIGNEGIEKAKSITKTNSKYLTDINCLINLFVQKLLTHKSQEAFHSLNSDGSLVGILKVLFVISMGDSNQKKRLSEGQLLFYLYRKCLFPEMFDSESNIEVTNNKLAVCQTKESRSYAYNIIYTLCESNTEIFCRFVSVLSQPIRKESLTDGININSPNRKVPKRKSIRWEYDPGELVKEPDAYVGLCNQGGTCYMNSFLQQLYHVKPFANGILNIGSSRQSPTNKEYEDVLFQLQVMFGHLRLSQKRYFDTLPFCRSFIDYDGQPISLTEQKDINEFAGMLFEKLEHIEDCKGLLENTIQGTFVWKTKSTESSYTSEREESFYMITAEVKDKTSLEDSLELNCAEELFSGDNKIEDDNGRKVEALRRCAIRVLPPTLIIHLKRFEFDLETMNRKKVNDFISFPIELDMYPYTEEAVKAKETKSKGDYELSDQVESSEVSEEKSSSYYHYYLKGVVAHVGAIDRGHYYSFINERNGNKWYEFNDRTVLPFSSEAIPSECFGGLISEPNNSEPQRMRENNAYLLFYERRETSIQSTNNIKLLQSESTDELVTNKSEINLFALNESQAISEKVVETIWNENIEFQTDRFLFEKTHLKFIWHMQQSHSIHDIMSNINENSFNSEYIAQFCLYCLKFDVEVLTVAKASGLVHMFFERLEELVLEDSTRQCAEKIIYELGCASSIDFNMYGSLGIANKKSSIQSNKSYLPIVDVPSTNLTLYNKWILQLFVNCPHSNTIQSFSRFIWTCLKALRSSHCNKYLDKSVTTDKGADIHDQCQSSVSRLMSRIVAMLERYKIDDIVNNDG